MVKKILYLLIAVVIGAFIYLRSLNYAYVQKEVDLMRLGFKEGNYEDYLAYTSPYFRENYRVARMNFEVSVYEIICVEDGRAKVQVALFVSKLNEQKFRISEDLYDQNDKTNLTVTEDDVLVYSHLEEMKLKDTFLSQSYGYRKYGGYYYLFYPEKAGEYTYIFYDYDGEPFLELTITHEKVFENLTFEDVYPLLNSEWKSGFDDYQKLALVQGSVHRIMLIYGIVVILFGLFLFRKSIFKRKT